MTFNIPYIPPITDPLGKYWEQPLLEEISLTLASAWMTEKVFLKLKTYQTSIPSGTYNGKMWKCRDHRGRWLLAWYGQHPDPKLISINYLRIQIEP
jgi:hypothetical protein